MVLFGNGHFIFLYFSKKTEEDLKLFPSSQLSEKNLKKKNVKRIIIKSELSYLKKF
jgi:hypothetical protein